MGRLAAVLRIGFVFACLLMGGAGFHAAAQTEDGERSVTRGPDRACLQCHKNENKMLGVHSKATNPNNQDPVTCTNCHGNTSASHRESASDVMIFGAKSAFPLDQRNGVCMSCHEVEPLRKALWAHDVHIAATACTNCHQLHPTADPMKGISSKSRIKLCVDCHGKLHEEKTAAGRGGQ